MNNFCHASFSKKKFQYNYNMKQKLMTQQVFLYLGCVVNCHVLVKITTVVQERFTVTSNQVFHHLEVKYY